MATKCQCLFHHPLFHYVLPLSIFSVTSVCDEQLEIIIFTATTKFVERKKYSYVKCENVPQLIGQKTKQVYEKGA